MVWTAGHFIQVAQSRFAAAVIGAHSIAAQPSGSAAPRRLASIRHSQAGFCCNNLPTRGALPGSRRDFCPFMTVPRHEQALRILETDVQNLAAGAAVAIPETPGLTAARRNSYRYPNFAIGLNCCRRNLQEVDKFSQGILSGSTCGCGRA